MKQNSLLVGVDHLDLEDPVQAADFQRRAMESMETSLKLLGETRRLLLQAHLRKEEILKEALKK